MDQGLRLFGEQTGQWFQQRIGTPTPVQREAWPAIASGEHVLVSAPTGTGKTLSAFLVCIDRLKALARRGELAEELSLIYISPLKALGNDIRENLRRPLEGIEGPELTAAIRTGDTTAAERRRMALHPPHILITTPESLYLLLTSRSGERMLRTARTVILDELHALIGGKRGAHLMLSLARLDALCGRRLQRIGLSATVEPLDVAADYLAHPGRARIVAPTMRKESDIQVDGPLEDMRALPEGTIWPELARKVYEHCQHARTVIVFVEGRAQTERLAYGVNQLGGEGFARTHHGCVSKEQRLAAERQLRSGELRLLCATSSMELGIDVGEVDMVLQVGFPRTISSTMQRLGRAGHNPGRTSVMHLLPRTAAEGLYCGLTASVAMAGGIERAKPPRLCLDVLAQHLVSMAAMGEYTVDQALTVAQAAYSFREVRREDICGLLEMLAGDYEHAADHPARPRVCYDRIHGAVSGDDYSRMLALSAGGTIPDRGFFPVRTAEGVRLGELEEEFVFEARVGDKFLLGAFGWRIAALRKDEVIVNPATTEGAQPPFWRGDGTGRDMHTGTAFGALLRELAEAAGEKRLYAGLRALRLDDAAARNAAEFLSRQIAHTGCLPDERTLLVEHFQGESGEHQMMVHSIFGRPVNAGLAMLMEELVSRVLGIDVRCFEDDDGFLVYPYGEEAPLPEGLLQQLAQADARTMLDALLPATPLFNLTFRYNAGRALMMGARRGGRQPLWLQRLKGAQALDRAVPHAEHPLMRETRRECLEDYLDIAAIEQVLGGVGSGAIAVRELRVEEPSPMSLPHRRAAEAGFMYDYAPRTTKVQAVVEQAIAAARAGEGMIAPAAELLEQVGQRRRQPENAERLHALLMAEGDLIAGEIDAPLDWLEELARGERAAYIEPGLWICAEQLEQYRAALEEGDEAAQRRIARRCLRYRGAQDAATLADRYAWPTEHAQSMLDALAESGEAVADGGLFYHAELYDRAQRQTVALRRQQARTLPPARYAALLARRLRPGVPPVEQLERGLAGLADRTFPPALWESVLLPARGGEYRPAQLDELLARGALYWRITGGERPLLAFHRQEDIDWEREPLALESAQYAGLDDDERCLVDALSRRGASFAHSLTGLPSGKSPVEGLLRLAERGLARADSFLPVRQWMAREKLDKGEAKIRAMARARTAMSGRWELIRPSLALTPEQRVDRAFDRSPLLCRETAGEELPWGEAMQVLRMWEYTGRVRRGYFIEGLSGAQFIREADWAAVAAALEQPGQETLWLNAADPAQAWGRILPHAPGAAFTCVPGTAVALRGGEPVAVLERQGSTLRVLAPEHLPEALAAFARDYRGGRVFPNRPRVTVKDYPAEAADALRGAGFTRLMADFELWKKKV